MTVTDVTYMAKRARVASSELASKPAEVKNRALEAIAEALKANAADIIMANEEDLERSEKEGLPAPMLKRLRFGKDKLELTVSGIQDLIRLDDPTGKTLLATELDDGLELYRVSCPIGVIGIIFESRPDALVQISTLCLKSGNTVILKGGSEARLTNRALFDVIYKAAVEAGLPDGCMGMLETRSEIGELLKQDMYVDLLIPRGSNSFVRYIMDNTVIPVMGHADGICHCYVDRVFDMTKALKVVLDAKTQYPAVCNAIETLLVHTEAAEAFLPEIKKLFDQCGVEVRGDERVCRIIHALPASEEDWSAEYLDTIISVKITDSLEEAIEHINRYGSGHTDAIITEDMAAAACFMDKVDSAGLYLNCSTRLADGFKYGFGAEVGISTGKLHARGPVGLEGLVTYKYKLIGRGQTAGDYASGNREFTHRPLHKECPL